MTKRAKSIIAFSLDGTINSFSSGWSGASSFPDKPNPGAFEHIEKLLEEGYGVVIFSPRFRGEMGRVSFWEWAAKHTDITNMRGVIELVPYRPRATLLYDARSYRYRGRWLNFTEIRSFTRPWTKALPLDAMKGETTIINMLALPVVVSSASGDEDVLFPPSKDFRVQKLVSINTNVRLAKVLSEHLGISVFETEPPTVISLPERRKATLFLVDYATGSAAQQVGRSDFLVPNKGAVRDSYTITTSCLVRLMPNHIKEEFCCE